MPLSHRVRQVIYYSGTDRQQAPVLPVDVHERLNEPMEIQFRILSTGDQRHLLRVFRYLKTHGAADDTGTAGLLHDVGKACRKCNISVVARCLHVFLTRFLPAPYRTFASMEVAPRRLMGLHRLANHAQRGALAARQAGYSERISWLIEHHESGGDPLDPELRLLRLADDTAGSRYDSP